MPNALQSLRLARFEAFSLDLRAGELCRGTERTRLQDKPLQMLRLLLEHSGEVVTREELQKVLWPGGTVVEFDHSIAAALKKLRRALGDDADHPRYIETLARRGYRWIAGVTWIDAAEKRGTVCPADKTIDSIAVLPFANLSGDPEQDYFCEGLAEEILNGLTRIPGLRVTARTSSFTFRGKGQDIRQIGQALNVGSVLEGSVRHSGNRIRITVQLINGGTGYHLWSEAYDRELTDVFAMQNEIAAAVAVALRGELMGKPAPARLHEPTLPAYEAYLKGRHQFSRRSPEGFARAKEYLEEAIALDPNWPDPHSALGTLHYFVGGLGLRPLGEMVTLARFEARTALELLPSDSRAHALLGAIEAVHDYDWPGAEEHFRLAMASEPVAPEIRGVYARSYLMPLGRFEEAIEEHARVLARDPLNVTFRTSQAGTFLCAGLYERALAEARSALEIDDRHYAARLVMAEACFFQARLNEARALAEEVFRLAPWDSVAAGFLAGLLVLAGEKDRAEKLIANVRKKIPAGMIMYHLICSEIDAAVDWYERDIELRQPGAAMLTHAVFLKPIRNSPRWRKLARMMNLPTTGF